MILAALVASVLVAAPIRDPDAVVARALPQWHRPVAVIAPVPPPTPDPVPAAYSGMGTGCAAGPVHDLIVAAFVDDAYALAIATRESGCNPNAYNETPIPPYGNASGVFQILAPGIWEGWAEACGYAGASPFDAVANVNVAACHVAAYGWGAWSL